MRRRRMFRLDANPARARRLHRAMKAKLGHPRKPSIEVGLRAPIGDTPGRGWSMRHSRPIRLADGSVCHLVTDEIRALVGQTVTDPVSGAEFTLPGTLPEEDVPADAVEEDDP